MSGKGEFIIYVTVARKNEGAEGVVGEASNFCVAQKGGGRYVTFSSKEGG